MRTVFKLVSVAWILSPFIFAAIRLLGIIQSHYDWVIFLGFCAISTFVLFLNYSPDDAKSPGR